MALCPAIFGCPSHRERRVEKRIERRLLQSTWVTFQHVLTFYNLYLLLGMTTSQLLQALTPFPNDVFSVDDLFGRGAKT